MTSAPPLFPALARFRGVTLIEAVLFISVALGLIVGGIVFYQQSSLSTRVAKQTRVIASIVTEGAALLRYNTSASGTTISGQGLDSWFIVGKVVPAEIVATTPGPVNGSFLRNSWDGELDVILITNLVINPGQPPETFLIVQSFGIPVEACARLAPTDAAGRSSFGALVTDVQVSDDDGANIQVAAIPLDAGAAGTLCRDADANQNGLVNLLTNFAVSS